MKTMKKVRNAIKNSIVRGFQSTCSATHITLKYGIDAVEQTEATIVHRAYGEDKAIIIKDRRNSSNATRLEQKRAFNKFREEYNTYVANKFGTAQDVIVETAIHN